MRKVFFPEWLSLGQDFVIRAFEKEGFEVDLYTVPQSEPDQVKRGDLAEELVKQILAGGYEFVFTVNFLPVVAIACKACRIKYLAWIYDSPCVEVYSETANYDTNYIFIFDRQTCYDLIKKGITTVHYLPMAADVDFYDKMLKFDRPSQSIHPSTNTSSTTKTPPETYPDISFIGSLYTETKPQFTALETADDYLRGYLDGLVKAQLGIYGANFLEAALTPEIILWMQKVCMMPQRVHSLESIAWIYANYYLAKKVTSLERTNIVKQLTESEWHFSLFSGEEITLSGISNCGYVDYYEEAPFIFHHSKINLNISLRSIYSGIPLRAFDIMGCGGFLLTNFQADFLEHFVPGEDFIYYENINDLMEKVGYYLSNENERLRITRNGYDKVKNHHTYRHRIREMLSVVS